VQHKGPLVEERAARVQRNVQLVEERAAPVQRNGRLVEVRVDPVQRSGRRVAPVARVQPKGLLAEAVPASGVAEAPSRG
jgi:hypothetical protein